MKKFSMGNEIGETLTPTRRKCRNIKKCKTYRHNIIKAQIKDNDSRENRQTLIMKTSTSRYHTISDVYTTALLLTNPSSDDDSGFRHGFGAEASLPLTQSAPAVSHVTTRIFQIVVALWDCQINADALRALSRIFSMYFLLSDGESPRLVKKTEVELAIKPLHPTSIGNTFVIQPFLTHCSCRSS